MGLKPTNKMIEKMNVHTHTYRDRKTGYLISYFSVWSFDSNKCGFFLTLFRYHYTHTQTRQRQLSDTLFSRLLVKYYFVRIRFVWGLNDKFQQNEKMITTNKLRNTIIIIIVILASIFSSTKTILYQPHQLRKPNTDRWHQFSN